MIRARLLLVPAAALLALAVGCLSEEAIRRIEGTPGQEGTGITLTRLPEVIRILATYEATETQREVAAARARRLAGATAPAPDAPTVIAVVTTPDPRSRGAVTVALWDTQTEEIVGNNVYDLEAEPRVGATARFGTVLARYAGGG